MNHVQSVIIVGSGFAGLGLAIRLREAGVEDFIVLEQADEVGGTWRDNRYPGCACDVQSHLYSFSFEPNPNWSREFAPQGEILSYLRHCATKYGVRRHIRFETEVTEAVFDEDGGFWVVHTNRGTLFARVLVGATGGLSQPQLPDIRGCGSFAGKTFHSARWDDSYLLSGKRVAVIGTGASAIQIVPAIAERVGQLVLFQRTPAWVLPKPDGAISEPSQALFRRLPVLQWLSRILLYWRLEARVLAMVKRPRLMRHPARAALQYLEACVPDPALREKLTPRYPIGCKRILMSNDYYQALCRPNAEVVTEPIREVTADGIVTEDGKHRAFDAIVYATGFSVGGSLPFAVRGRGGRTLEEQWRDGAEAYLATSVPGFPNLFLLAGPNSGLGHTSMIFMLESLMAYIVDAIRTMERAGLEQVEVREEVSSAYNALVQARFPGTVWAKGCKSWYLAKDGRNIALWPGFTFEFRRRTRRFDTESYLTVSSRKVRRAKPLAADKSAPRVPASARPKPVEQTYGQFG